MSAPTVADLPAPPAGRLGWPWTGSEAPLCGSGWPRITVVTPSFQQAEYLEETIRSVLLQGYPNLEYFVIDGGSDDGSRAILDRYSPFLSGWRSAPDRGQAHALNEGFARATGEIHGFLNSDDLYEPGALRAVAEALDPSRPWVVGGVRYLHAVIGSWPVPQKPGRRLSDWFLTCPICQPGSFWAAGLQQRAGPFREDLPFALDYEMWLRFRIVLRIQPTFVGVPVAVYRLHQDSKTVAWKTAFSREMRRVRHHYEARLPVWSRWRIALLRRHCRARYRGRLGASRLLRGSWREGAGAILSAVGNWPFVLADPTVHVGLWRMARREPQETWPEIWPDWEMVWGLPVGCEPLPAEEEAA